MARRERRTVKRDPGAPTRAELLKTLKVRAKRHEPGEAAKRKGAGVPGRDFQVRQNVIRWFVDRRPEGGFQGEIHLPTLGPGAAIRTTAPGKDAGSAIANAATLAEQIVNNPILSAVLPPGTGAAIKATKMLSKYGGADMLEKGMKLLTGKGAKRVADAVKSLKFW